MSTHPLFGRVVTGRGEAAGFTRLDWVRDRLLREFGIDPHPGTVNLIVDDEADREAWSALQSRPGTPIDPPDDRWCTARGYAVRVNGWLPAAVVLPDVPAYPAWQVELVAALSIREALSLVDGSRVGVEERPPLPVRAVIFDVDGTLVDSLAAYRIVAELAAAPYGVSITDAVVREALCTTRAFWDLALPADQPDRSATIQALARDTARLWPEVLRAHGRVCPHARASVEALRRRGVTLGIFTGSRRGSLGVLAEAGLLDAFDAVVTGEDIARRKPDPEGLLTCAAELGVQVGEAAYVGDTPLDVQAGRAAGMSTVAVLGGAGESAALSAAGPDHLVGSLARVPGTIGPLYGS
jgi:phosphoglycolate phosphatase